MLPVLLAAASQLSAPVPINQRRWFSGNDFPPEVQGGTAAILPHLWLVPIRVDVSPDGKIRDCKVEASSGERLIDRATCEIVRMRAKFLPARMSDGSAAYGAYRSAVSWAVTEGDPEGFPHAAYPDLEITVKALPAGKVKSLVRVMFSVDEQGHPSSCVPEPGEGFEQADNPAALAPIACEQLEKNFTAIASKDDTGNAVRSVQDAVVLFSVGH